MSACPGMMLGAGYPLGQSIGGFFEELVQRLYAMTPPRAERRVCSLENFGEEVVYDFEFGLQELNLMLEESGAKLYTGAIPLTVEMDGEQIGAIQICHRDGIRRHTARIYIDCTGNGDIAHRAGVKSETGDNKGTLMGGTLTFFMEGVDCDKVFGGEDPYFMDIARKGIQEGKIDPSLAQIYMLPGFYKDMVYLNTVTVGGLDGRSADSVEERTRIGRRRAFELARYLVEEVPGFENARLCNMGSVIGVRESRRMEGLYQLRYEEVREGRKFFDGVVACDNPLDMVFQSEDDPINASPRAVEKENDYYTIPARCLVPRQVKNLLFAGRQISADWYSFTSIRGMPQCMGMGMGAAVIAKLALEGQLPVQEVDFAQVPVRLQAMGVRGLGDDLLVRQ